MRPHSLSEWVLALASEEVSKDASLSLIGKASEKE